MVASVAVYDFVADVLRGRRPAPATSRRALAAPVGVWERVLGFEGCAAQFRGALRAMPEVNPPAALADTLRAAASEALQRAMLVHRQLQAVARLASGAGIRIVVLKGAARLLAGEVAGERSIGDIDLLVPITEAQRFHDILQRDLGYDATGEAYLHHLAGLTRPGSLGIEVHLSLGASVSPLDDAIWNDTRSVALNGQCVEIPSATNMLLHVLEHGVRLNVTGRYRLRDILDVATLCNDSVAIDQVRAHIARSDSATAMETLVSAAHDIAPLAPLMRMNAWRTVRRVARSRIAAAALSANRRVAERLFRYVGLAAEASPRTIVSAGGAIARRLLAIGLLFAGACTEFTAPASIVVQPFVFQSNAGGLTGIYRFDRGTITRLSASGAEDSEAHSAAGRIVFTSRRDGNPEIYMADLALGGPQRLTSDLAVDDSPALSPSGATIAFVSDRSGTPRIWLMDATGANPRPLDTGTATYVPEGSPRWRPDGAALAFTSTRTNTSQVFVLPTAGSAAAQVSHEATGAFMPQWSANGERLLFVTEAGASEVVAITVANGARTVVASAATGVTAPACAPSYCLFTVNGAGGNGDLAFNSRDGGPLHVFLRRAADDRNPALLVP